MIKRLIKSLINQRISKKIDSAFATPKEFGDLKTIERVADSVNSLAGARGFSEIQKYELLYTINRTMIPDFVISERGRLLLDDQDFRKYFQRFADDGNWKYFERRWNFRELLKVSANVEGDLAECGVYKGANAYQLCLFAKKTDKEVHLFDSFEGLSSPNENDGQFWTQNDLSASEDIVRENLKEFDCFKTFRGWIPDAFPKVSEKKYSFLHIDVDLEQPTYDSIAFFYPRINTGGIILLDDHGYDTCPGARKAVLDFMADKPEPVLDLSSGQGLIIKL